MLWGAVWGRAAAEGGAPAGFHPDPRPQPPKEAQPSTQKPYLSPAQWRALSLALDFLFQLGQGLAV